MKIQNIKRQESKSRPFFNDTKNNAYFKGMVKKFLFKICTVRRFQHLLPRILSMQSLKNI